MRRAGPEGFDPTTCGSEDRRDILATLRALSCNKGSHYIKPDRNSNQAQSPITRVLGIRQLFCDHGESFAYRKYDDYEFTEYCRCKSCGKVLKSFAGFDEDMRG